MNSRTGPSGIDVDVAVVGGGLAGLAAAERLAAAGRSPVVLEATGRVGGRQRSTRLGGQVLEEGAVFFGSNYPELTARLTAFGLDDDLKPYELSRISRFPVGRQTSPDVRGLLTTPHLPWHEKLAVVPFTLSMMPAMGEIRASLGAGVQSARVRRLDRSRAADWLGDRVGPAFVDEVAGPFMEALGFAPAQDWSALGAMQILAFGSMAKLNGIKGGNDRFARGMAEGLEVRCGAAVADVEPRPSSVTVTFESGDPLRARDVVLAVPAPIAHRLVRGSLQQALSRFLYSSSIVAAVAVPTLGIDLPAVSIFGGTDGHERIRGIVAEQDDPEGAVVSYAALAHPWQYEYFDAPDEEIVTLLTDVLAESQGSAVEPLETHVVRWRHSIPIPVAGSIDLRRDARRLASETAHLRLAGDYLVSPSQEGALVSGMQAAEAVLAAA